MAVRLILERGRDPRGLRYWFESPWGRRARTRPSVPSQPRGTAPEGTPLEGGCVSPSRENAGRPRWVVAIFVQSTAGSGPWRVSRVRVELPHSHGCLAARSASHSSLPAPPRPAPDDASAGWCLANPASSARENWSRLLWGKRGEALMGGRDPSVSQTGQPPGGVPQPLPPAPHPTCGRHRPAVGGWEGAVVFLGSHPSLGGSSPRRGSGPSGTYEVPSEGPMPDGLCRGGQAHSVSLRWLLGPSGTI